MATYNFIRVSSLSALTRTLNAKYENQADVDFVLRYEYGYVNGSLISEPSVAIHNNAFQGGSSISRKIHSYVSTAVTFPESTRESVLALMLINLRS